VRYYTIVISAGDTEAVAAQVSGLATQGLGIVLEALGQSNRRVIGRRKRPIGGKHNSIGLLDFVSITDPNNSQPTTFNALVQTDLNNLGKALKVPPTLSAIVGAPIAGAQFTSVVGGHNDPGALDIEFDITLYPNGQLKNGWLKIYGINQNLISQATSLNHRRIQIYAGFSDGLPLANLQLKNQGLIADGMILPCYGNWIGNELSIEFIINAGPIGGPGGPTDEKNIIHNMPVGTTLSTAIRNALGTAFPNYNINVNISDALTLGNPDQGFHQGIEQYQDYVKALSHSILGNTNTTGYQGVTFNMFGDNINVTDGTRKSNNVQIQYSDLIGQPTWSPQDQRTLQIKTCLRGDIAPADGGGNPTITLPTNLLVSTPRNASSMFIGGQILQYQPGDVLNFQGTWTVISVRHVGKFRQPTGESWVTIIDAYMDMGAGVGPDIIPSTGGVHAFSGEISGSGSST
jgi:hypothetical protein